MLRHRLARLLTALVVLALVLGTTGPAVAQDATPAASPVGDVAGGGPTLGDAVVLFDNRGGERAQIAVVDVVDPFEETASDAQRGYHYVAIEVVVQNLTDELYPVDVFSLRLVDGEGGLYGNTYVSRSEESLAATVDLSSVELEGGDATSGLLVFEIPDGAAPALIAYTDGYQTFTLLADLRDDAPDAGDPTPLYDERGDEIGAVSLDEALPALEDTSAAFDVGRGETVLGAVVTIENTGDDPLTPDLFSMYVVDEFGFLYGAASFFRDEEETAELPDLSTEEIAPGDDATGLVAFTLPNDAVPSYVLYTPAGSQLFIVAQLGEGPVVSGDELTPIPPAAEDDAAEDDAAEDEAGPGDEDATPVVSAECAELADWGEATAENLAVFEDIGLDDVETVTAEDVRDAAEVIRGAAEAQAEIDAPDLAVDANAALVTYLGLFADALEEGADEVEAGGDPEDVLTEALFAEDSDLIQSISDFTETTIALQTACPDLDLDL